MPPSFLLVAWYTLWFHQNSQKYNQVQIKLKSAWHNFTTGIPYFHNYAFVVTVVCTRNDPSCHLRRSVGRVALEGAVKLGIMIQAQKWWVRCSDLVIPVTSCIRNLYPGNFWPTCSMVSTMQPETLPTHRRSYSKPWNFLKSLRSKRNLSSVQPATATAGTTTHASLRNPKPKERSPDVISYLPMFNYATNPT